MHKHPTPPPHDPAFLAQRDPARIREWLTSYLTAVVEWSSDIDLLHAFETVWQFQDSGRAVSYLIMGRSFESACIYQFDPNCDCLSCTWEVLVGGPPINLKAIAEALDNYVPGPSCQTPHGSAEAKSA